LREPSAADEADKDSLGGLPQTTRSEVTTPLGSGGGEGGEICAPVLRRIAHSHGSLLACTLKAHSIINGFRANTRPGHMSDSTGQGIRLLAVTVLEGARENWTAQKWASATRAHRHRHVYTLPATFNVTPLVFTFPVRCKSCTWLYKHRLAHQ
jgi:hypothetical protein